MRRDKKLAKRAKNDRLYRATLKAGICHGCGLWVPERTHEHAPPLRAQRLIDRKYLKHFPMSKIDAHEKSKKNGGIIVEVPGGLQFLSFCDACQRDTARWYGQPYFDWTAQVKTISETVTTFFGNVRATVEIQPLEVIKQIATSALAASTFDRRSVAIENLQRFVRHPQRRCLPGGFDFYAYLNPIRTDYQLPLCRVQGGAAVLDTLRGERSTLMVELAVPPLGYVVLFRDPSFRPTHTVRDMMNINHFGDVLPGVMQTMTLDIPVKTPFGPAPLRYWQDPDIEHADRPAA